MLIQTTRYGNVIFAEDCEKYLYYKSFDCLINNGELIDQPYICIDNNELKWIALPINYNKDLFYCYSNDNLFISDNFYVLANTYCSGNNFDDKAVEEFYELGYIKKPNTWIREIKVFLCHSKYSIVNGDFLRERLNFETYEGDLYNKFKIEIDHTIEHYRNKGKKHALLLSGGADSRLLALLLTAHNIRFTAYVSRNIPFNDDNLKDVLNAKKIADTCGFELKIVDVHIEEVTIESLQKIINYMPLYEHPSFAFIKLMERIKEDGCDIIWTGQNADTLYNLGPTERFSFSFYGLMNAFKRACLTEEFFSTYKNVRGYSIIMSAFRHIVLPIAQKYYGIKKKCKVFSPKSINSLIKNFSNSRDYTIFSYTKDASSVTENSNMLPKEIKDILFNYKVENYARAGECIIIAAAAESVGIQNIVWAYSSEFVAPVFHNIRLKLDSIKRPKLFIYKYIEEFKDRYGDDISIFDEYNKDVIKELYPEVKNIHESFADIIQDTDFGRKINIQSRTHSENDGMTGIQFFNICLRDYWIENVSRLINNPDLISTGENRQE